MENKLKMWEAHASFDEADAAWEVRAQQAACQAPIRGLNRMPQMVGITEETARNLKWKSFWWMLTQDHTKEVFKGLLHHPFRYGWRYLKSLVCKKSYKRDGDFFFYGIKSEQEFEELLQKKETLFVVGFSYCHKPFECPSGRFTSDCMHELENPVCQQCFIGKMIHALPQERTISLVIPTVHYIGGKIFEITHAHPDKKVVFLITACEMTLEMFGDWGNMVGVKGIGVRLDGRICNTMRAFELSEQGVKPGLTVVLDDTKKRMLDLIRQWRQQVHTR